MMSRSTRIMSRSTRIAAAPSIRSPSLARVPHFR
jgi:hypothetical protein